MTRYVLTVNLKDDQGIIDNYRRYHQDVWPEVRPYFDDRALASARRLGLPTDPAELAELAPRGRVADLAAALVRADLGG